MVMRQMLWEPDRFFADVPDEPDERTVWSPIGTPLIDPAGTSDAAVKVTMRRPVARALPARALVRDQINSAVDQLEVRRERDHAIMRAVGAAERRTQPWSRLRPDAVVELRTLLVDGALFSGARLLEVANASGEMGAELRAVEVLGRALLLGDAVPFFLPASVAAALMTSEPPDDELISSIRLPFPSVFVFFDAVRLGDLELDGDLSDIEGAPVDLSGASLVGMVLYAGPDGVGLDPVVEWVVTYPIRDVHGVVVLSGVWGASAHPGVVANVSALCTWGDWTAPPAPPRQLEGEAGSREWRRSLARSAVRKALARGAIAGVHVIELASLSRQAEQQGSTGERRAVRSSHWRRGYWTSVRVATRDADGVIVGDRLGVRDLDWHYEGRWIHPVLVRGASSEAVTIYTIQD